MGLVLRLRLQRVRGWRFRGVRVGCGVLGLERDGLCERASSLLGQREQASVSSSTVISRELSFPFQSQFPVLIPTNVWLLTPCDSIAPVSSPPTTKGSLFLYLPLRTQTFPLLLTPLTSAWETHGQAHLSTHCLATYTFARISRMGMDGRVGFAISKSVIYLPPFL